ncbi:type II toxin-antitoxin system death-on-curing family toxin [Natrinema gari]|uniref:Death-on-curing family protein n=1 Tax=Natrinema gari JCM 14663 TaxID=1230459 RepID=L9Z4K6_9EURY|nr:type II toxin-antitoxin system death-on-curing family toxin [Natrinema gari]ELY81425.1 death-on-curing family protein [Natrinema gari JCM 14663]
MRYLSVDDVLTIHELIVEDDPETDQGVQHRSDIGYATGFIEAGAFGQKPETIHEKAFHLMRLLTANHPFVDGNKRTALSSTVAFYALNGFDFDYGNEIRTLLKQLATDESEVDQQAAIEQFEETAAPIDPDVQVAVLSFFDLEERARNDYPGRDQNEG